MANYVGHVTGYISIGNVINTVNPKKHFKLLFISVISLRPKDFQMKFARLE